MIVTIYTPSVQVLDYWFRRLPACIFQHRQSWPWMLLHFQLNSIPFVLVNSVLWYRKVPIVATLDPRPSTLDPRYFRNKQPLGLVTFGVSLRTLEGSLFSETKTHKTKLALAWYHARTRKFIPPPWYKGMGGGGDVDRNPLQSFSHLVSKRFYLQWKASDLLNKMRYRNGRHLGFYQELEIWLKPREMVILCAWHKY